MKPDPSWWIIEDEAAADALLAASTGLDRHHRTLAFADKKGALGLFVFERYTGPGGSVVLHWTGLRERWLKRGMLPAIAWYAFEFLKVERIVGEIPHDNTHALQLAARLGFYHVATLPGYFPGTDLGIYYATPATTTVKYGQSNG